MSDSPLRRPCTRSCRRRSGRIDTTAAKPGVAIAMARRSGRSRDRAGQWRWRCRVHKLPNLERKAPKHALAEIRGNFHRIIYAANADVARAAYAAFKRAWAKRCLGVMTNLGEGGDELLSFFRFHSPSGRPYEPRIRLSGFTRNFAGA
jgi:hypothetical protein